jgi:hypothetical protein
VKTVVQSSPGVQTTVALQDGALITGTTQDQTAIAEDAKARHKAGMFGSSDMRHAARVGAVEVEKYLNDNHITFNEFCGSQEHIRRFLMDPSRADFRIWKGAL